MLSKYPQPLVFGLDIGTRSIVGTVGYQDIEGFHVVAQCVKLHDTRAMLDGQIHDIATVAEEIRYVKSELELQLERPLTEVCIAAAGRVLKTAVGVGEYEFHEPTVVNLEYIHSLEMMGVEKAHEQIVEELGTEEKYYCVGYTVIKYYLNGYEITNLEGHKARTISGDVLATFLPEEVVDGLYAAVEQAGLTVSNLTLEPIAAMNVAIPQNYRLLNICLVDVGAGTSDICVTKDGSIIGYGMIPSAGDEITERIVREYLVDFNTAEKIKMISPKRKTMTYKDIMGLSHKVTPDQVYTLVADVVRDITGSVADKIIELNGGKTVSAVFVVGGGGKLPGFTQALAKQLGLPEERVALRGEEVMQNIYMHVPEVKKDPLLVTPIGICLNYYDQKNNFIFVLINEERIKLYNNDKLTVFDAAMQLGLRNDAIFPKRGKDLHYTVNGKSRFLRGHQGEAAVISVNGHDASINAPIEANDQIRIRESTSGEDAELTLKQIPEFTNTIEFYVNDIPVQCPKFASVNGHLESEFYQIRENDEIQILNYYTLDQLLTFMDIRPEGKITVNNELADANTKIYENFKVAWSQEVRYQDLEEATEEDRTEKKAKEAETPIETSQPVAAAASEGITTVAGDKEEKTILVNANGKSYTLTGKNRYVFVEIFDAMQFDTSKVQGTELVMLLNGRPAEHFDELKNGDQIQIYWRS